MTRKSSPLKFPPWGRGFLLIFLVYFYFLLFSQFSFLQLIEQKLGPGDDLKSVLGSMALAGITGSFLAYYFRRFMRTGLIFAPGLFICSAVAFSATHAGSSATFTLLAVAMGLSMGLLTVSVAAMLPLLVPTPARGLIVGAATGLAYATCNLPPVFAAGLELRCTLSGLIPLFGGFLLIGFNLAERDPPTWSGINNRAGASWNTVATLSLVAAFAILIAFDSAVFYVIQETRSLKEISWQGNGQLYMNAAIHLAAAVAAGWALDRGMGTLLLLLAWIGLAVGAWGLQATGMSLFTTFYVIAVSVYSTALVFIPSLHPGHGGEKGSFKRAALVYAIAGWLGSGMGIGMVENLSEIPLIFIVVSVVVILPLTGLSNVLK